MYWFFSDGCMSINLIKVNSLEIIYHSQFIRKSVNKSYFNITYFTLYTSLEKKLSTYYISNMLMHLRATHINQSF